LNMPRVSVRDIKIQTDYNDLVLGTHGRGAWILDDLAPVQHLAEAMGQDLHVFPARRATHWQQWGNDASPGQRTYQGDNAEPGAVLNFYLADAPESPVKVRITDSGGGLVQEFPVRDVKAGVNRTLWNLRPSPFFYFFIHTQHVL